MINRELRGVERRSRRLEDGSPELAQVPLVGFHPVPDIDRLLRAAFDVNEKGQIAAHPDRVEMIEKEEPVAAEQILDVVLGGDDRRVHARFVKQIVKARAVERQRSGAGRRRQ